MSDSYPRPEMDLKLEAIHEKLEQHGQAHIAIYQRLGDVHDEVKKTNGKVKKIIIALTAIGAFALGSGLQNISVLLKLII